MTKQNNPYPELGEGRTFVSLYSGAGGLDLGFARAGFTPVFANDIVLDATATHSRLSQIQDPEWAETAKRFQGHTAVAADVRSIHHMLTEGMADVVVGGPPCQGFSVAGRMDPEDPRSKHVFDFLGLVKKVRPRAFVMENVAALARNKRWSDVIRSLQDTAGANYRVELVVLNASHWGVAQARERMFLIGTPASGPGLEWPEPPTVDLPPSTRSVIASLPPAGEPGNEGICTAKVTLAKNPILRKSPFAGMLFNVQGRVINLDKPAPTLPASMGGNRTPIIDLDQLEGGDPWIVEYHERLFYRGEPPLSEVPTHARMRRLTVQEAAAIQSFPRDVPWQGRQSAVFRQIGNAVPPLLGYAVAKTVAECLNKQ